MGENHSNEDSLKMGDYNKTGTDTTGSGLMVNSGKDKIDVGKTVERFSGNDVIDALSDKDIGHKSVETSGSDILTAVKESVNPVGTEDEVKIKDITDDSVFVVSRLQFYHSFLFVNWFSQINRCSLGELEMLIPVFHNVYPEIKWIYPQISGIRISFPSESLL